MATKPKAILSTHDGREASPITKASNVLFENGQTAQDILNDRQDAMISPVIENSSSMFKVGQGDNVDYSSNVVNGAYESMVLKGKSMVNCIQEPSSQDVVLPYEFADGQYVTINDTKESGALGVELKGQTLVNVVDYDDLNLNNATRNGDYFTLKHGVDVNQSWVIPKKNNQYLYKPDTVYTIIVNITENTTGQRLGISNIYTCTSYANGKNRFDNLLGESKLLVRTGSDVNVPTNQSEVRQLTYFGIWDGSGDLTTHIKFNFMILEGDWTDKETPPYFEGMASCKMPILKSVGKNLCKYRNNWTYGGLTFTNTENGVTVNGTATVYVDYYVIDDRDINLEIRNQLNSLPVGTRLILSNNLGKNSYISYTLNGEVRYADNVTIQNNMEIKGAFVRFQEGDICNNLNLTIQLEVGKEATTYEPHKSSILSLPEEVALRSLPNGICDTFNIKTGIYTQRIGECILDGSESWSAYTVHSNNVRIQTPLQNCVRRDTASYIYVICDKLPSVVWDNSWLQAYNLVTVNHTNLHLQMSDTTMTKEQMLSWLQQNPLTVQYELATPIVTKINLSSTLKSWNTTTYVYSEIPENTLYPTLTHSNPTYPVILKPSTKYSIVANSYGNSHTNSTINFNLGGSTASTTVGNRVTTITTPSTLSNELLTMSGRGNKLSHVMVIEGDVVGDEPYFEGICDCKSPILSNVGKNLFGVDLILGAHTYGNVGVKPTHGTGYPRVTNKTGDYIPVKPNTTYIFSINNNISFAIAQLDSNGISLGDTGWVNHKSSWTMTTHSMTHFIGFNFKKADDSTIAVDEVRNASPMLEESSTVTSYKPYKTNILSCNGDKIELTADMFEQGTFSTSQTGATYESVKENNNTRIRSKKLMRVKPNTTYRFKFNSSCQMLIGGYDSNQKCLGSEFAYTWLNEKVFTTPANGHYISIAIRKGSGSSNITPSEFNSTGLAIWEVDKTIVLRSLPNGVCDTLNVETGEYVQRIGETVLDGSDDENWGVNNTEGTTTNRFISQSLQNSNVDQSTGVGQFLCDKLKTEVWNQTSRLGLTINGQDVFIYNASIDYSASAIKQWLSQNPITVQYELATPITKTVDLSGYPFAYKNGHVILSSGSIEQSLTPKVEYSVATNRNGQIRSNQKMVERHQKQLDQLQAIILANLVNSQYNQTLTTLKYELSRV